MYDLLRGFGTKLVNKTGNNSARGFSEGKSEAMNYTRCCQQYFIIQL